MRSDGYQEFEDDCKYPIEVAGPRGSAEDSTQFDFVQAVPISIGIHAMMIREIQVVGSLSFQQPEVLIERTGVGIEVVGIVELGGIDIDADDCDVIFDL